MGEALGMVLAIGGTVFAITIGLGLGIVFIRVIWVKLDLD